MSGIDWSGPSLIISVIALIVSAWTFFRSRSAAIPTVSIRATTDIHERNTGLPEKDRSIAQPLTLGHFSDFSLQLVNHNLDTRIVDISASATIHFVGDGFRRRKLAQVDYVPKHFIDPGDTAYLYRPDGTERRYFETEMFNLGFDPLSMYNLTTGDLIGTPSINVIVRVRYRPAIKGYGFVTQTFPFTFEPFPKLDHYRLSGKASPLRNLPPGLHGIVWTEKKKTP